METGWILGESVQSDIATGKLDAAIFVQEDAVVLSPSARTCSIGNTSVAEHDSTAGCFCWYREEVAATITVAVKPVSGSRA